jgi:hypothetical protein
MNGKKINEFPSGSGTLSDDDIFLMMDNPLESGAMTKSLSFSVLRENINELVLSDLTTVSGIVDGVSGVLRADLTTVSGIVDGIIVTNSGDNRILTSDGSNRGINGESNLTFDGNNLFISNGNVNVSGTITSDSGTFSHLSVGTDLGSNFGGPNFVNLKDLLIIDSDNFLHIAGQGFGSISTEDNSIYKFVIVESEIGNSEIENTNIGILTPASGNFVKLTVNNIDVSISGHTHTHNQIFVSGVSGVAPIGNNASNFLYEIDDESSLLTISGQVITTQSNKSLRTIQGGYGLEKAIDLLGGINTSNINSFDSTVSGIVINILQQLNIIGY